MITETQLDQLALFLRRIFLHKIARSTIREVQNALMATTSGDQETAKDLFETLVTGRISPRLSTNNLEPKLKALVAEYALPIRMAQEAFERGEFVNLMVSDLLSHDTENVFAHRLRRLDGEEFSFMTDPVSTLNMLQHFAMRLEELSQAPGGKESLQSLKGDIQAVKAQLDKVSR